MAFCIKHPEADRLARELAAATGESLTDAIIKALRERLIRETGKMKVPLLHEELKRIRERCSQLPVLDNRSPEEILGYNDQRLP